MSELLEAALQALREIAQDATTVGGFSPPSLLHDFAARIRDTALAGVGEPREGRAG